ncbi:MAG: TonB family protein [Deltaproteobacteria bacterium]|nr:TonB family protein [Deltaproteobacteria bacterium]
MRGTRKPRRIVGFVGLSLLAHLNLLLLVGAVVSARPEGCQGTSQAVSSPVEVSLVAPEDLKAAERAREAFKKQEEAEQKKEKDEEGQVVDLPPPAEEKRPEKSRFLSEHDSRVQKETKGPPIPFRPGRVIANRPQPRVQPPGPSPSAAERAQTERKVLSLAMRTPSRPELPRSPLPRASKGDEPSREERPSTPGPRAPPGAAPPRPAGNVSLKELKLSDGELARVLGSRVNDALSDVDEGETTLLNSKRWRFASFFNRVKRQVAENWHPDRAYQRRDPSGNVYGFKDRLTILRVKLSPQGKLKYLHIEKACGVDFLDDEAIAAFKAAEPFPNPPNGLVDPKTGLINFRFGFLFEISRRPSFRIFRFHN